MLKAEKDELAGPSNVDGVTTTTAPARRVLAVPAVKEEQATISELGERPAAAT